MALLFNYLPCSTLAFYPCSEYSSKTVQGFKTLIAGNNGKCKVHDPFP